MPKTSEKVPHYCYAALSRPSETATRVKDRCFRAFKEYFVSSSQKSPVCYVIRLLSFDALKCDDDDTNDDDDNGNNNTCNNNNNNNNDDDDDDDDDDDTDDDVYDDNHDDDDRIYSRDGLSF